LSSYNRRLCLALACNGSVARVLCLMPNVTPEDRENAEAANVQLIEWSRWSSGVMAPPQLPDGVTPTLLIGHSRITGPQAKDLRDKLYPDAQRTHLIHMAPDVIDWEKPDPDVGRVEDRTEAERDLGATAEVTAAVGHHTYQRFLRDLHDRSQVIQLDPGFRDLPGAPRTPPPGLLTVLLFGRMEDEQLKGVDLAARGLARALHRMRAEGRSLEVEFVVRGGNNQESLQLRDKILAWAREATPGVAVPFDVTPRSYTTRAERLEADLRRASLVLMPSRAEAFGLVGAEAIEHGVPVLISDTSGLGAHLRSRLAPADANLLVVGADPTDPEQPWEWQIRRLLTDREDAFARVERIRKQLVADRPWTTVASELLTAVESVAPASRTP
jgi:glycosyltransferase involved in cell wall biosynthesis